MRIVAIRGRNLASLAGEYSVELDRAPIATAGVFLISGPVGAGKSTLLDTMCLALFDRTPRLGRGSRTLRIVDGSDEIGVTDPRSLLRRGCAEGYAEVEFVGRGGKRWVARWEVRRARDRVDGKLQPQAMSLRDVVSGTVIAGNKTEVLDRIRQELGLDYGQFCRSVLLAQNDFAAFLHASKDERAELLERMTGTEVYAHLGKAAYERAAGERQELERLELRRSGVTVLGAEERRLLDDEVAALAAREGAVRRDRAALEAAARAAEVAVAAREALGRASATRPAAQDAVRIAAEASGRAAEAVDAAARARAEAAAELKRARELDGTLISAERDRERCQREHESAGVALQVRRRAVDQHEQQVAGWQALAAEARRWLDSHGITGAMAPDWARWRAEIRAWRTASESLQATEAHRRALEDRRVEAGRRVEQARQGVEAAATKRAEAREALSDAREVAGAEAEALAAERARREAATTSLERLLGLSTRAADQRRAAEEAAELRSGAARERQEAGEAAGRAEADARLAGALLGEAEGALRRLEAAEALAPRRRELLADGEACPLCGSTEHPHADVDGGALSAVLREQRDRVAELRRRQSEGVAASRAAVGRAEAAGRAESGAEERLRRAEAALSAVEAEWTTVREDLAGEEAEFDDVPERLDAEGEGAVRALAVANTARLDRVRRAERALAEARGACDLAQQAEAAAAERLTAAERAVTQVTADLAGTDEPLARHAAERERARSALVAPFAGVARWEAELEADPAAFEAHHARAVDLWNERRASLDANELQLGRAEIEGRGLRTQLDDAQEASKRARLALDAAEIAHEEALTQRRGALGGRSADEVEAGLESALTLARKERDAAAAREGAAREALARAEAEYERALRDAAAAEEATASAGAPDPARLEAIGAEERELHEARVRAAARVHQDDQARASVAGLGPEIERQQARVDKWGALATVIGSADGARFRVFAQGLTLDALVAHANEHLGQLAPRYRLARVPGQDLELQVIDRALGGEARGVNSLSGGETFLASLALALGLSSLASQQVRVQSLFIDEGFGTLDPDTLDGALSVLDELQATGRQIGIISHVPGMGERFGVRVEVLPMGAGRAAVRTVA